MKQFGVKKESTKISAEKKNVYNFPLHPDYIFNKTLATVVM